MPATTLPGFTDLADRFGATLDAVDPDAWQAPSPCDGWRAADVVAHVIETQSDFLSGHGLGTGLGDLAPVADDPAAAWRAHAASVAALLAQPDVADLAIDGFFGPTTIAATLHRFYGFDLVVHRWDVARATGGDSRFSDPECDLVEQAIDGFGDHMYADGICTAAVAVDDAASRQDHILGRTGRDPAWPALA